MVISNNMFVVSGFKMFNTQLKSSHKMILICCISLSFIFRYGSNIDLVQLCFASKLLVFNTFGIKLRDADRVERIQIKLMSQLSR